MRIGFGFDAHRFIEDVPLMLGGVLIPSQWGLQAHSDGDVVLHALCDALLGALALGDIGLHFPDTDPKFRGAASHLFVTEVMKMVTAKGHRPQNIDCTIIAEKPKLQPHYLKMRENMAELLALEIEQVSIKASTTEKMGAIGRGEGIACQTVVLLERV